MSKTPEPQSLESYLAQIEHELRDLPASVRVDEMREIGSHLGALALAGQQLENLSLAQSTAIAIRQFGEPRAIGRNLRRAWERKQPESWWRAGLALAFAMGFFLLFAIPSMRAFQNFYFNFSGVNTNVVPTNSQTAAVYEMGAIYCQFLGCFSMIFATYIMGLISPKRSKWVISLILVYAIVATLFAAYPNISLYVSILDANLILATMGGTYFGARHGRRWLSRIADSRENMLANHILQ